ncbi:MAG: hypothetical protein KIT56_09385 [Gammaproteobacteria bacterium]|nr:hypothetical protein [Gammaproteobacteria bacterium]MCW5584065.1 hypothetical protein [Gammaproteobacteria bacterium]
MAVGIFSQDALRRLPFVTDLVIQLIALELLIIWIYFVRFYIQSYLDENFNIQIKSMANQYGIGTWVASSSVLAILFSTELPSWNIVIWFLALFAFIIWLIYLKWLFIDFFLVLLKYKNIHTGIILLSTVSIQSIVLLAHSLLTHQFPILINQMLIILGCLFYLIGIFIIVRYHINIKFKYLILNWSNTNSIIHGALSITGLASVLTNSIDHGFIIFIWILATCLFFLIEGISLVKMTYRIKLYGCLNGIVRYDLSQWARIFTYGMYYAFTLSIFNINLIQNIIVIKVVNYGQYIVFGILLAEIILFYKDRFRAVLNIR